MPAIKSDGTVAQTREAQAFSPYTWAEPNALAGLFGQGSGLALTILVNPGDPGLDASSAGILTLGETNATAVDIDVPLTVVGAITASNDIRRSYQTPTETVLVSGISAIAGELIEVTLTAARLVGAPLNLALGQFLTFTLIQGGGGGFAVTWNAIFKVTWADTGNTTGKRSTITFYYDGTSLNQIGAQAAYV